jgi:hypothetical protein
VPFQTVQIGYRQKDLLYTIPAIPLQLSPSFLNLQTRLRWRSGPGIRRNPRRLLRV